jgi:hypothetical protein
MSSNVRNTHGSSIGATTRQIPNDLPRREIITDGPMFGTPVYRWLPAKSKIESHFLLFYARVPEGFQHVDDITLENGRIVIQDRRAQRQVTLAASRGL